MDNNVSKEFALKILENEATKIKQLLSNQENYLCIAQCKAFEEVVDTQMYGFSRQISYATQLGVITIPEGQEILGELEFELNKVYNDVYDGQKNKQE